MVEEAVKIKEPVSAVGECEIGLFCDFLFGLYNRSWTGCVSVELDAGATKKIFFEKGNIVFCTSSLVDDRLGEVAYRRGLISLKQLFESSTDIKEDVRLGQALMTNHAFTPTGLWGALKVQVWEILKSIFLEQKLKYELHESKQPFTKVTFNDSTADLIERTYSYGKMFHAYKSKFAKDMQLVVCDNFAQIADDGTFYRDMLEIINQSKSTAGFFENCKLPLNYAQLVVLDFVQMGLVKVDPTLRMESPRAHHLVPLKEKITQYQNMVEFIGKKFKEENIAFPSSEFKEFARRLNEPGLLTIAVLNTGALSPESIDSILLQSNTVEHQARYFERNVEALTNFSLQVGLDLLPPGVGKAIRSHRLASYS